MKYLFTPILMSVLAMFVSGQLKNESVPLRLFLNTSKDVVCSERSSEIIVELKNSGRKPLVIDTNLIGSEKYFQVIGTKDDWLVTDEGWGYIPPRHYKSHFVMLLPGEAYVRKIRIVFDDAFFAPGKRYEMRVSYRQATAEKLGKQEVWRGDIQSNSRRFAIRKCDL